MRSIPACSSPARSLWRRRGSRNITRRRSCCSRSCSAWRSISCMRKADASPASNFRRARFCASASACSACASRSARSPRSAPWPVATVIVGVATTIVFGFLLARRLGLSPMFGVLSGGAVAICGASAALAIASVLPRTTTRERDTILTVVSVTALSTLAMILYPVFATSIGLDHKQAGVFIGGTIHDVAQVVGAGYTISNETGDIATYVKLLRVAMLLPAVFAISFLLRDSGGHGEGARATLPLFLVGFAVLVLVNSFGLLPQVCHRPRQRRVALVSGRGDRGARHEDLVQGAVRGRLAAGRAHGGGNPVDRGRGFVFGQDDYLSLGASPPSELLARLQPAVTNARLLRIGLNEEVFHGEHNRTRGAGGRLLLGHAGADTPLPRRHLDARRL